MILSSHFRENRFCLYGRGVYFTDSLDYCSYYSDNNESLGGRMENFGKIPSVGESFSCVGSEIYYDESKIEYVYDFEKTNCEVQKNGIRVSIVDFETRIMKKIETMVISDRT